MAEAREAGPYSYAEPERYIYIYIRPKTCAMKTDCVYARYSQGIVVIVVHKAIDE